MAAFINTNTASLNAQRNLTTSQSGLTTSLQRLSSGLRINSAKDDAAGLAISDRMTSQIRGLTQAARNANDGISLAQTGEGALSEITNNLQRIRELSVQSVNSSNSASDRAALDLEVQQRLSEIDRVSSSTSFNGLKILNGSAGNSAFQIGANVGETISIDMSVSMRTNSIGSSATAATSVALNTLVDPTVSAGTAEQVASFTTGAVDLTKTDFSSVAATAGSDTVAFASPAAVGDSVTLNGVTFTFADTAAPGDPTSSVVTNATSVTVKMDMTGATAQDSSDALKAAIDDAKSTGAVATAGTLATISTASSTGTLTISDSTAGLHGTANRTLTASAAAVTQDVTGSDADNSKNASFKVGATTVNLTGNYTTLAALASAIDGALTTAGPAASKITVAASGTGLSFTNAAGKGAAGDPVISASSAGAIAAGIVPTGGTAVAGKDAVAATTAKTLTLGASDLSIKVGSGDAVNITGTFTTSKQLVDSINSAVAGANASIDANGKLSISSSEAVTIAGTKGTATTGAGAMGFTATNAASGNLDGKNVLTATGAVDLMQRVDSALKSVSTMRSTFGAVQNRFESTISNLQTTSENLSASRSRIQDTDFASETASLTRGQILQQAGTAMLAQANSLPNGVLALLRG
jgi:flagellin